MATFVYTARDRDGNKTVGSVSAKDSAEARTTLRYKDLFVTDIREKASASEAQASSGLFRRKKIKLSDMVVMSRQLATLVRAGISIIECLHAVAEQAENQALANALREVRVDVLSGTPLAVSMRKLPKVFNEKYTSLVEAGETGGVLEATLEVAAEQFDKEAELREKVKGAFVYPALVLASSVAVVTFMLLFIVPVFAKVYDQVHATLPLVTLSLVTMSDIILHYWLFVIGGIWLLVFLIRRYVKTPGGRLVYDKIVLKIPVTRQTESKDRGSQVPRRNSRRSRTSRCTHHPRIDDLCQYVRQHGDYQCRHPRYKPDQGRINSCGPTRSNGAVPHYGHANDSRGRTERKPG